MQSNVIVISVTMTFLFLLLLLLLLFLLSTALPFLVLSRASRSLSFLVVVTSPSFFLFLIEGLSLLPGQSEVSFSSAKPARPPSDKSPT